MCNTTDSSINPNNISSQDVDHKLTLGETAQELGKAMGNKLAEAKDSVLGTAQSAKDTTVDTARTMKESAIDMKNDVKGTTIDKTNSARQVTADKLGDWKESVAPPKEEPENKTVGDVLADVRSAVAEKVDNIASNIHAHPDEEQKTYIEEMKTKEDQVNYMPVGTILNKKAEAAKDNLDSFAEDTKKSAKEQAKSARSWAAANLETLQDGIEPPKKEPETKNLGDKLNDIKSTVFGKVNAVGDNVKSTINDVKSNDEDEQKKDEDKPLGRRINDNAQEAKKDLDQFGEDVKDSAQDAKHTARDKINNAQDDMDQFGEDVKDSARDAKETAQEKMESAKQTAQENAEAAKETAQDKSDSARSWTADKLGNLQSQVEPPNRHPEQDQSKDIGDHLNDAKSAVASTAQDIHSSIQNKISEIRATDDPHEDSKLRDNKNKPL